MATTEVPGGPLDAAAVRTRLIEVHNALTGALKHGDWIGGLAGIRWALDHLAGLLAEYESEDTLARQVTVVTLRAAFLGGADYRLDVLLEHLQDVPGLIDLERVGVETRTLEAPYRGGPVFAQGAPDATEAGDASEPC